MGTERNQSTIETTPRHIWMHEVELAAIALGSNCELARDEHVRARLNRAYVAGEPVWMAAEELAMRTRMVREDERKSTVGTVEEFRSVMRSLRKMGMGDA